MVLACSSSYASRKSSLRLICARGGAVGMLDIGASLTDATPGLYRGQSVAPRRQLRRPRREVPEGKRLTLFMLRHRPVRALSARSLRFVPCGGCHGKQDQVVSVGRRSRLRRPLLRAGDVAGVRGASWSQPEVPEAPSSLL